MMDNFEQTNWSSCARASEGLEGELDPKEEKMLDWILNAVVISVLGWLALGILLSIGGLFHLWG